MAKEKNVEEFKPTEIRQTTLNFAVLGRTPLIMHAMSQKGVHELLFPKGRKTNADRAMTLKHDPLQEYRSSSYKALGDAAPTRCLLKATAFKAALSSAAKDMPGGAKRTEVARLTYVNSDYIDLYGKPELFMAVVRCADKNRTPDIRTRAIFREWACYLSITFTEPLITAPMVANLLGAAGVIRGVGDWRPEKGSGNYGQFELVDASDPRFQSIIKSSGREAQDAAFANPSCYDSETAELYSWFNSELENRRGKPAEIEVDDDEASAEDVELEEASI